VKCKMQVQMLLPVTMNAAPVELASTAAGALSPADVTLKKLPGPISVLKNVIHTTGLKGLWLGQTGTLIRETGGGVAWFVSKEAVARMLLARSPMNPDGTPRALHAWESAFSGACAGVAYNFALFPADTVKSTVQTEAELRPRAPGEPYPSFLATTRAMYKAQGLRGLYAGCGITVARAVPSSALIFLIYDGLSKRFG
jgi:mitochondrial ornithine carrier protein